jgi:hypothetical protein
MISLLAATVPSALEFNTCEQPDFEWAVYGTRATGRMYAMTAAITGNHLFAGGFLKSTLDPDAAGFVESDKDYAITGPFTSADPEGSNGNTVTVDVKSYPTSGGATENAGGTFRGYEVAVAKIDLTTGQPVDVFVYYGEAMDENSGLAASGDVLAISGHFAGNLSAHMSDDTISTILNSNTAPGELPDADDQFHPNAKSAAGHTGVDDGFVIKASASTGKADWIKHYPQSNSDAQVVGVDVDAAATSTAWATRARRRATTPPRCARASSPSSPRPTARLCGSRSSTRSAPPCGSSTTPPTTRSTSRRRRPTVARKRARF